MLKRTFFHYSLIFSMVIAISECKIYQVPNLDDKEYWHNYNINYLKKILNSHSGKSDSRVAKNVILFIGDGMSLATVAAGRVFKGQLEGKSGEETELVFENFPHVAMSKTYNTDSQVPDSAATATALFSGIKTSIRAVGLNPARQDAKESDRLKNIMDWAQEVDKRTGIVTTTRITHATPAAAYAFSFHRDYECDKQVPETMKSHFKDIARQLIENKPGNKMNVIFGGGRDFLGASIERRIPEPVHFGGGAEKSCNRTDKVNLVEKYLNQFDNETIAKYVTNTGELMDALADVHHLDHVLGLFSNNHLPYNTLRNTESSGEPSLTEMTKAAIRILGNKKNKNGYVLMVEGGKIDHAHHQNHARFALEEFVEFERAIKKAVEMTNSDDTLIIVTSDHAHAMIYNGYSKRGNDILGFANKAKQPAYETLVYASGPGFWKHLINGSHLKTGPFLPLENFTEDERADPLYMTQSLIPLSDAAHSGEDVAVYSKGPGSFLLQRVFEQSYIAYAISFSACIGPAKSLNPSCSYQERNNSSKLNHSITLLLFPTFFILILKFIS